MSNKNFQSEENEILSGDDEKVRQMLGALNRIDAPKDFDFRLKARIANAKPQDFQAPRLFPVLRYAAPLGLAIIVLAVIVINGLYSFDNTSVATVDDNLSKPKVENSVSPNNFQPEEKTVAKENSQTANTEIFPAVSVSSNKPEKRIFSKDSELAESVKKPKNTEPQAGNNGGGSRDSAVTNPSIRVPNEFSSNNSFQVKDVLSFVGIEANFADNKWKVKSLTQNGHAERIGIKTDDVIEAINDNKLSTETIISKGALNVKKLTIIRGSEKIEINLQNK